MYSEGLQEVSVKINQTSPSTSGAVPLPTPSAPVAPSPPVPGEGILTFAETGDLNGLQRQGSSS